LPTEQNDKENAVTKWHLKRAGLLADRIRPMSAYFRAILPAMGGRLYMPGGRQAEGRKRGIIFKISTRLRNPVGPSPPQVYVLYEKSLQSGFGVCNREPQSETLPPD